ncbi:MAG TPA: tetratricopeptide repeat protein, partial [Planctomycetes bacterium]|nr:tetratricopeptide repeat protein [Planctomycetota bacterium]
LGKFDDAIADYTEAIRIKPDLVAAYNNRPLGYGVRRCRTPGGSANMGFSGSAMTLYGETTSDSGICEVHLDGKLVATVDLYSKRANREFVIYKNDSMKQGFHSISLRATGRANPRSSGTWVAVDGMTVRYQAVDDENELFADLTTLYLDASASYGRDTIGQNKKVKGIRAKLDGKRTGTANKPATGAAATNQSLNDPMQLTTQTADLREHLKALRSHMESLTYSIEQLQARLIALDAAIREKEKALEQAARPKKK